MSLESYRYSEIAGSDPATLVFTFHGTGGDEHQFTGLAAELFPGATVISPRGDVSEHGASRYFRRTGEGIYDMADLAVRTEKMARFITAHKAQAEATRVVGLGYSNGANILASVLFAQPDLFDEIVLLHPLIPFAPNPNPGLTGKRVLITAGRHDPICPPGLTERLAEFLYSQRARVNLAWHDGGHELRPSELAAIQDFTQ